MKIIYFILLVFFLSLLPNNSTKILKSTECKIGDSEARLFAKEKNKLPLTSYFNFRQHIYNLIQDDEQFAQSSFINTTAIYGIPDSIILKDGSCIKINLNNEAVNSIIFVSHNNRIEWSDTEMLMKALSPFNQNEHWYSSDIYKIAVNIAELRSNRIQHEFPIYFELFNFKGLTNLTLYNEQTDKVTIFLYKTPYKAL